MHETTAEPSWATAEDARPVAGPCATPAVTPPPRAAGDDGTVPFAERAIADFETELKDWETRGPAASGG